MEEDDRVSEHYRLSIVLPAHNEESNVGAAIERAAKAASRLCGEYEVIIVDDGSVDTTADVTRAKAEANPHVRLVSHERNRGYGEALHTGFRAATMDLVFFTDADNQFDFEELEKFLPLSDRVGVVAGYRKVRQDPWRRRFTARVWNLVVRALFYVPVRDIDCAFKLFRRSVLEEIDIESIGAMVNTELMVKLGRSGHGVAEVGVTHYPRTSGKARGATPKVVLMAIRELRKMRHRLREMDVHTHKGIAEAPTKQAS
jgi:glycosyltransferase involved in cell wall biosynthesis